MYEPRLLTYAERSDIAEQYLSGAGLDELAAEFHVGRRRVYDVLAEFNVPVRAKGRNVEVSLSLDKARRCIILLDTQMATLSRLAKELKMPRTTLRLALIRAGWKPATRVRPMPRREVFTDADA